MWRRGIDPFAKSKELSWGGEEKKIPNEGGPTAGDGEATLLPTAENGPPANPTRAGFLNRVWNVRFTTTRRRANNKSLQLTP